MLKSGFAGGTLVSQLQQERTKHADGPSGPLDKRGRLRHSLLWGLIGIAIVVGVFFRFNTLTEQGYFADELVTSAYVSGFPTDERSRAASHPSDVLKYEHIHPDTSVLTVVENLSKYCADQTPGYYVLCRVWAELTGGDCSAEALRPLSALIGLLLIGAMYFLCLELFGTSLAGGIGAALTALSPFHVIWSQHARNYGLWSLLIVCSMIALLRATRLGKFHHWFLYAFCATAAIYTHLLSVFVVVAQTLSVFLLGLSKSTKNKIFPFSLSLVVVVAIAWIWRQNLRQGHYSSLDGWMERKESFQSLGTAFCQNIADCFLTPMPFISESIQITVILTLLLYSLYYLNRHARRSAGVHVTALALVPFFCLLFKDVTYAIYQGRTLSLNLVEGAFAVMIIRYLTPCIIGFQLALVFLASENFKHRNRFPITLSVVAVFLVLSTMSCLDLAVNHRKPDLETMARIINDSGRKPVLVKSKSDLTIPLARLLREDVKLVNLQRNDLLRTAELYPGCFVFATQEQIDAVTSSGRFACKPFQFRTTLWQINRIDVPAVGATISGAH